MGWILDGALEMTGLNWVCGIALTGLSATLWRMQGQFKLESTERWRERRMREELEAYARLEPGLAAAITGGMAPMEATRGLAMRVCRLVADKSAFSKVGMVLRDAEGKLYCAGRVGIDDLTVKAIESWGAKVLEEERGGVRRAGQPKAAADRGGVKSFTIPLGEWKAFDAEVATRVVAGKRERRQYRRGIVAPVRTQAGKLIGAIVVAPDGTKEGWPPGLERAMGPLESLAARIASSLENENLNDRVLRAEKLAGLGQLAGGVAHALNNPLTAVLGFAEMIAESSTDARAKQDAGVIVAEALKMKDTVQRLTEFWRPSVLSDETVDLALMLREIAASCETKLRSRNVELTLTVEDQLPRVRGNHSRVKQVMEHLLNNAAQAIAAVGAPAEEDGGHSIRITASHSDQCVHLIVSDTGAGFAEPARVFDPFYTTKSADLGSGLGLSICYGIVREHEGEISAFNLHPRGAAVVVELPVKAAGKKSGELIVMTEEVRTGSRG